MDLQKILRQARAALARGASADEVNARIQEVTDGQLSTLSELETAAANSAPPEAGPMPMDSTSPSSVGAFRGPGRSPMAQARDLLRIGAHGLSLGSSDEIAGALARMRAGDPALLDQGAVAPPGHQPEAEAAGRAATEAARADISRIRKQMPMASMAAEAAGSVPLALLPGVGIGTRVAGATGSRLLGSAAGAAAGAGIEGGLFGFMEGEGGLKSRTSNALGMGALAAGAGALLGPAISGVGRIAARVAGTGGADDLARNALRRSLEQAGLTEAEVVEQLSRLPDDAVVADLSPSLGREARASANAAPALEQPGGPVQGIRRRGAEANERIASDLREAAGVSGTFREAQEAAQAAVEEVREAFYRPLERQYEQIEGRNVIDLIANDPDVRAAAGRTGMGSEGGLPSFREVQDLVIELRDDAIAAAQEGRPGRARRARQALSRVEDALTKDVPEFAPAQRAYARAKQRVEAHELGRKLVWRSPDEIATTMEQLTTPEAREAFRFGMLDKIEKQLLERTEGGSGTANRMMDAGDTMRQRLRMLAESDEGFERLLSNLETEGRYRETLRALRGNSTTAQQQMDARTQFPSIPRGMWDTLSRLVQWVGNNPESRREAAERLGRVLLSDGESAARELAQQLAVRSSVGGGAGAAGGALVRRFLTQER